MSRYVKDDEFCFVCEVLIKKPDFISGFMGNANNAPVKFKKGWMCADCYKKAMREKK